MYNSKRTHRRVRLLAMLSIVMLFTSVFPWFPATAQEGSGSDPASAAPPSLSTLSIECNPEGTNSILATVGVLKPQGADTSVTATVELYANTGSDPVLLSDLTNSGIVALQDSTVTVVVQLPAPAADYASSVIARASITSDGSSPVWSEQPGLPVYASNGASLCGTEPLDTSLDEGVGAETADTSTVARQPANPTEETTGDTDDSTDTTGTSDQTLQPSSLEVLPPSVASVAIACITSDPSSVDATVGIANPPTALDDTTTVTVQLFANGSAGKTGIEPAITENISGQTSVPVKLPLPASDIGAASVSASAWIGSDPTNVQSTTADLEVHFADGKTNCGPAPSPSPSVTPSPSATASATASLTPSPTATATPSPTPTTQFATVVNTEGADLRCRAAPVTGTQLGLFPAGARVELRGPESGGWYPVVCPNGQAGFSSGQYLSVNTTTPPTDPAPGGTTGGVAIVQGTFGDGLRCRTAPVTGNTITVLPDGTRLNMRGAVENGWAPVTCAGQAGWISTQYARIETGGGTTSPTPTPTTTPTPTPSPGTGTGTYGTVVNTDGMGLRCRTAPINGAIILVAPEGTKLETRGAAVSNWYPVVCNGQAGHVSGDYFTLSDGGGTTTPPPVSGTTRQAMVSGTGGGGLRCRTQPVDGGIITVMPEGALVEVRGDIVNGWAPVKCAGTNGWSSATYLSFNVSSGATGELWMDVNLSTQYMRVYRGSSIIGQTYVSTGRWGFETPTGTFYINWKLPSQTMTGVLGGEYYYVPNVPWVMYFTNVGHAIHGAYWHNNFGSVMSHGCINLPVGFAEWLYSITPYGTRLRIHY